MFPCCLSQSDRARLRRPCTIIVSVTFLLAILYQVNLNYTFTEDVLNTFKNKLGWYRMDYSDTNAQNVESSPKKDRDVNHASGKKTDLKHSSKKNPNVKHSPKKDPNVKPSPKKDPNVKPSPKKDPNVKPSPKKNPNIKHSPKKNPNVKHSPKKNPNVKNFPRKETGIKHSPRKDTNVKNFPKKNPDVKDPDVKVPPKKDPDVNHSPKKDLDVKDPPKKDPDVKVPPKKNPDVKVPPKKNPDVKVLPNKDPDVKDPPKKNPDVKDPPKKDPDVNDSPKNNGMQNISNELEKKSKKTRYIIYYCVRERGCSGWGDRQNGIVSIYVLSLAMDRRFGFVMLNPCNISKFLRPNKVDWELDLESLSGLQSRYLYVVNNRSFGPSLIRANLEKLYPEDVLYVTLNYNIVYFLKKNPLYQSRLRRFRRMSPSDIFIKVIDLLFRPSEQLQTKAEEIFIKNSPKPDIQFVCSQIRIGKNPTIPNDHPRNNMSTLPVVWKFLSKYNNTNKYKIFITTDSEQVLDIAKEKFDSQLTYVPGKIVHVDKVYRMKSYICDSVEKMLIDQLVLTKCDILLVSRSNFGENAARLSKTAKEKYIFKNGNIIPFK
ncbi:uncharacterized protein LOC115215651 isoform X2 [Argonauta hians]